MNEELDTYLKTYRNQIFKLLPMREAFDKGEDNHLSEFLENLRMTTDGAMRSYPILSGNDKFIVVKSNIASLNPSVRYETWRSVILRSTRLITTVIETISKKQC